MSVVFKRVSAIDKCFDILDLFARSGEPLGISEVSRKLELNKSTVFNTIHTLTDLNILEKSPGGKFIPGTHLYTLGNSAGLRSHLIRTVRPCLELISKKTGLSAFLGIMSGMKAVIIDKEESAGEMKVSSEIGMSLPLLAGAGGKALLCQLPDREIDKILAEQRLKKFTPCTNTGRDAYKKSLLKTRQEGIAIDKEEYLEGVIALAVPLPNYSSEIRAAIWAAGLKHQFTDKTLPEFTGFMKGIAGEINQRFSQNEQQQDIV